MKFKEVVARLTGFSSPIFGISWNPPQSERSVAKKIIAQLEDRRVLYNPCMMEDPYHCIESVLQIRQMLTDNLSSLKHDSKLCESLRAMRAGCRKFLNNIHYEEQGKIDIERGWMNKWIFYSALGELRGVFGLHLVQIATQYGLDIEDELASILPESETE